MEKCKTHHPITNTKYFGELTAINIYDHVSISKILENILEASKKFVPAYWKWKWERTIKNIIIGGTKIIIKTSIGVGIK